MLSIYGLLIWTNFNRTFAHSVFDYNKELHENVSKSLVDQNGVPQMGENSDQEEKGMISSIIKKGKVFTISTTLKFFDMPNQLLPENIIGFSIFFSIFLL